MSLSTLLFLFGYIVPKQISPITIAYDLRRFTVLPLGEVMGKCTSLNDFPVALAVKGLTKQYVGTNRAREKPSLIQNIFGTIVRLKPLEENKRWIREVGVLQCMLGALP